MDSQALLSVSLGSSALLRISSSNRMDQGTCWRNAFPLRINKENVRNFPFSPYHLIPQTQC